MNQQEEKREIDADVESAQITEEYEAICADIGRVEEVIEKYKSALANKFIMKMYSRATRADELYEELTSCILLEAEANVDNRRS